MKQSKDLNGDFEARKQENYEQTQNPDVKCFKRMETP